MTTTVAGAGIRVDFDDATGWTMRDLERRRSWRIDAQTAAIVIAFLHPGDTNHVVEELIEASGSVSLDGLIGRIAQLRTRGVLVDSDAAVPSKVFRRWAAHGWGESFDYLQATWDFPFEDYSKNGQSVDKSRMQSYAEDEPDTVRALPMKGDLAVVLPTALAALDYFDALSVSDVSPSGLMTHVLSVAAAVALPTEWLPSRTSGDDYMLRTSPSGGCRHPSELYLLAIDVPGLARAAYHVGIREGRLGVMSELPSDAELKTNIPGAYRLGAPPRAIFVVSTHFDRNMYRYREPRTLRTVYYDAGHFGGVVEFLCEGSGLVAHGHQGFSDSFLAGLIRSSSLATESPSYVVAIGFESELYSTSTRISVLDTAR